MEEKREKSPTPHKSSVILQGCAHHCQTGSSGMGANCIPTTVYMFSEHLKDCYTTEPSLIPFQLISENIESINIFFNSLQDIDSADMFLYPPSLYKSFVLSSMSYVHEHILLFLLHFLSNYTLCNIDKNIFFSFCLATDHVHSDNLKQLESVWVFYPKFYNNHV